MKAKCLKKITNARRDTVTKTTPLRMSLPPLHFLGQKKTHRPKACAVVTLELHTNSTRLRCYCKWTVQTNACHSRTNHMNSPTVCTKYGKSLPDSNLMHKSALRYHNAVFLVVKQGTLVSVASVGTASSSSGAVESTGTNIFWLSLAPAGANTEMDSLGMVG